MTDKELTIEIIGGGPAGMSVAYFAKINQIKFKLFEASNEIGGNCKTFKVDDFYFDSGAHRFHDKDKKTTELVKTLMKDELRLINIPSQIYINRQFINFPLSPLDLLKFLGLFSFFKESIKLFINKIKFRNTDAKNFKEYCFEKYGEYISNLFLISYSKKLWGENTENLSVKIAGKRLKGLNIKSFFLDFFNINSKSQSHLDGIFYYPKFGIGSIFDKINNVYGEKEVFLNSTVTSIKHSQNQIKSIMINDSEEKYVNHLVSSLPLDVFMKILNPAPPKQILEISKTIKYRNLILIVLFLDKPKVNNNGSMYFPSQEYLFTRIYEPKNRSEYMSPNGKTSLVIEIPCQNTDAIWKQDKEDILNKILPQLLDIGFFNMEEIINSQMAKIKRAYPILDMDYDNRINPIFKYLSQFENLSINGRNGKYEYNHIHDHLIDGCLIVEKLKQTEFLEGKK